MEDDLPFEDLYPEESDLNIEGILYRERENSWSPAEDVDWEKEIDLSEEKRHAAAEAATQFYYSNISHLMLCGRLLEKGHDIGLKKLALYLAFSKMRNVDAFGRYLSENDSRGDVAPYTKEYFNRMSSDQGIPSLLLGMGVLGGTVGYGTLEMLEQAGDPIVDQISHYAIQQKRANEDLLVNYLQDIVDSADEEEMELLRENARFYRDRSEKIVVFHGDLFRTLEIDPEEVVENVLEATDQFYEKIGLELDG